MTDALDELTRNAKMMDAEDKSRAAISKARAMLVMGKRAEHAFFATIAMSWKLRPAWWLPTMAVDGTHLFYNPSFVVSLITDKKGQETMDQLIAVLVHEVLHDALGHHYRRGSRDPEQANIAMDLAINPIVAEAGFKLPECGIFPGKKPFETLPVGKSFEEYYAILPRKTEKKDGEGDGKGKLSDPGGCGGVIDAGDGSPADLRQAEAEGKMRLSQAKEMAKQKGKGTLPGWLDGLVSNVLEPKVNWKQVLRRFLTERAKSDYSWVPPNRRWLAQGVTLPGCSSEAVGTIVVSVDASGSCWDQNILTRFASEVNGILASYQVRLIVMYNDTRVVETFEWAPGKGRLILAPRGGGGTDHNCVFDWISQKKLKPNCLVCLTDLDTNFPASAPAYPVLWCSIKPGNKAPWGQTIEVEV